MKQFNNNFYFIIDFDSTFTSVESLEELADITLENKPDKKRLLTEIKQITNLGMEGKISFTESLERRLLLFQTTRKDIDLLIKILKKNITPSVKNNKEFFNKFSKSIFIVSGGFKEFISPIVKNYGISEQHILANTFVFDKKGYVTGFDKKNPLSKTGGKVEVMKGLKLEGTVYIIGDGFTDYEIRLNGHAEKFFAFTENIKRKSVIEKADYVSASFDEILYRLKLPRSQSFPKTMIKALIIGESMNKTKGVLEKEGYFVTTLSDLKTLDKFSNVLKNIQVLLIKEDDYLPEKIFNYMPKLLTIGLDKDKLTDLQIKKATQNGIALFTYKKLPANHPSKYLSLCNNILKFINSGDTRSCLNLPEVSLPKLKNAHRFIHIHENKPGVLARLNAIFAENDINIDGQYLKTNKYIGYAITDVNKDYGPKVVEELKSMPNTIKVRILY